MCKWHLNSHVPGPGPFCDAQVHAFLLAVFLEWFHWGLWASIKHRERRRLGTRVYRSCPYRGFLCVAECFFIYLALTFQYSLDQLHYVEELPLKNVTDNIKHKDLMGGSNIFHVFQKYLGRFKICPLPVLSSTYKPYIFVFYIWFQII